MSWLGRQIFWYMKRLFDSSQIWLLKAEWITFKLLPITTAGAVDAICNAGDAEMLWVPAEAIARILSCDFDLNRDCKRVLRELQLLDTLRLMECLQNFHRKCRTKEQFKARLNPKQQYLLAHSRHIISQRITYYDLSKATRNSFGTSIILG